MNIDWIELSRAVPYAGIAIVFAVFVYIMAKLMFEQAEKWAKAAQAERERQDKKDLAAMDRQDQKDRERDERYLAAIKEQNDRSLLSHQKQQDAWREFVANEAKLAGEQRALMIRELERVAQGQQLTHSLLREHDTWERAFAESAKQRRASDRGLTTGGAEGQPSA